MIRVESNQPTKRNNARLMLTTATGAAIGAAARYVVPTKNEWKGVKESADTFFSNTAATARSANRSILKYAAVGAVVAAGLSLVSRLFAKPEYQHKLPPHQDTFEYSKYQALIDAPEYACEILLYED